MKTLSLSFLLLLLICSCSPESFETYEPHTPAEPVTSVTEPVVALELPHWIEGTFRSRLIPSAPVSVITEYTMLFDFTSFGKSSIDFGVEDVEYDVTETQVTIYCSDTETILLRRSSVPESTDIRIAYMVSNHIYEYGMFEKIN